MFLGRKVKHHMFFSSGFPQISSGLLPGEHGRGDGFTPKVVFLSSSTPAFICLKLFTGWRREHHKYLTIRSRVQDINKDIC